MVNKYSLLLWFVGVWALLLLQYSHAQNFQNALQQSMIVPLDFLTEVYQNPEFLPLIDVDQAKIQLQDLSKAFQKTLNQYQHIEQKKGVLTTHQLNVQREILTIFRERNATEARLQDSLTKIALYNKKILSMQETMSTLRADLRQQQDYLAMYIKFLYSSHVSLSFAEHDVSLIKLLARSENIAESLSVRDLSELLTINIKAVMDSMAHQHAQYKSLQRTYADARNKHRLTLSFYKSALQDLEEQQKNLHELLVHIQTSLAQTDWESSTIEQTQWLLHKQISQITQISQAHSSPSDTDSPVKVLLATSDREPWQRFFSWPVFPPERLLHHFRDDAHVTQYGFPFDAVRLAMPQRSDVYAPAPWVVFRIQEGVWMRKSWVILLHKHGYATVLSPLSEIFVSEWMLVHRWQLIGRSGGLPGTKWAWVWSPWPHLDVQVLHNGEPVDPLRLMDISIFADKQVLPSHYHTKYLQDYFSREVDLTLQKLTWSDVDERARIFLQRYAQAPFHQLHLWHSAAQGSRINTYFGLCIGFAETSFKNFKTPNNIGNVGNNDRGDTVTYESPEAWMRALFSVLNNQYLWGYHTLDQLSRFGNSDGFIYASSPFNWQKNIMNCLSSIYGYNVPEDFAFRVSQ
jgi:murein DD-endopeptidase MepM/ murein hydrolase activator NlpD